MKKIYSASVTPLSEAGEVDRDSLARLLEFNLEHGIDGFLFLGSMGEWAVLSEKMKETVLETAAAAIAGKAEILAGISSTGFAGCLDNLERYGRFPCDGFVVQFPAGWARPRDPVAYIHNLADHSDRPLYLYYLPQVNGVTLSEEQFRALFRHPRIRGIKNSSDSLKARKELLVLKRELDFTLFEGQEWCVDESLLLGCDGALVGMASLGAKLFKDIARAVDRGDGEKAFQLQSVMIEIFDGIYGKDLTTVWSGQKYALTLLGIMESARTLVPAEEHVLGKKEKRRIRQCLEQYRTYLV